MDEAEAKRPSNLRDRATWRYPSSPLQVTHSTHVDGIGQLRSVCQVSLLEDAAPLPSEQRDVLVRSFVQKMERQIAEGTHEPREHVPIPPIVMVGYGPLRQGIHGCRVIVTVAFDPEGDFFAAMAGEQITHPCAGEATDNPVR